MSPLYILNPTTSSLTLAINGERVGSLRPSASKAAGYTPAVTWLGISEIGLFTLDVTFQQEPGATYRFPFVVPKGFQLEAEDVVAAVTRGALLLTRGNGGRLPPNPVPITGELLPLTETQQSLQEGI